MDPASALAAFTALLTVIGGIIGFVQYRRGKREKLQRAQSDQFRNSIDHPVAEPDPDKRLYIDKPNAKV